MVIRKKKGQTTIELDATERRKLEGAAAILETLAAEEPDADESATMTDTAELLHKFRATYSPKVLKEATA